MSAPILAGLGKLSKQVKKLDTDFGQLQTDFGQLRQADARKIVRNFVLGLNGSADSALLEDYLQDSVNLGGWNAVLTTQADIESIAELAEPMGAVTGSQTALDRVRASETAQNAVFTQQVGYISFASKEEKIGVAIGVGHDTIDAHANFLTETKSLPLNLGGSYYEIDSRVIPSKSGLIYAGVYDSNNRYHVYRVNFQTGNINSLTFSGATSNQHVSPILMDNEEYIWLSVTSSVHRINTTTFTKESFGGFSSDPRGIALSGNYVYVLLSNGTLEKRTRDAFNLVTSKDLINIGGMSYFGNAQKLQMFFSDDGYLYIGSYALAGENYGGVLKVNPSDLAEMGYSASAYRMTYQGYLLNTAGSHLLVIDAYMSRVKLVDKATLNTVADKSFTEVFGEDNHGYAYRIHDGYAYTLYGNTVYRIKTEDLSLELEPVQFVANGCSSFALV